jgi:DNA polymerase-3 subunit alpha
MDMGVHACGIVVSDGPITDFAPVCVLNNPDKEGETVRCTQYDGWHVESTGLVRFDFIGQKVLSQQKAICEYIKSIKGINIDLNKIPLDDSKTFKLFQKEKTEGVFCFDVDGMRQWLHYLHPTKFNDLVILNVMYRPEIEYYIPQMLQRKNGKEKIEYPIPAMEKYLHETYGMVIYQEQIMFLCRLLADFTRAESDMLRKALGRKKTDELSELKAKFIKGGLRNGHKKAALEKIWKEWEEKGKYAINKAHVVCLTWLAYQMAYLKAHYPEEFKQVIDKDNLY